MIGGFLSAESVNPAGDPTFDPPLRGLIASGGGNVVVTCANDDPAATAKKVTISLTAGTAEGRFQIRKVWNTGTTATGLMGLR